MKRFILRKEAFVSLALLIGMALGYQPTTNRRNILQQALVGAAFLASPVEAVISSKYCSSGVGEGCQDLNEGNELIQSLQEKSAVNRERYQQVRKQNDKPI